MKPEIVHPAQVIARSGTSAAVCYDILGILGEGGSGIAYRAMATQTQQLVALKALSLRQSDDWKAIELFERETQVLSTLDRDGIPKYLDYFTIDRDGECYFYIAQELAPGKTLLEWMRSGWRASEAEVKDIAIQILEILIYLHRHYPLIVHRDLKPSNILRTEEGKIFLVDFGAIQQTYHDTFMRGSTVVGTYGYMAPEQFRGQAVPATDLYGLGATILHLLTHRSPAEIPQDGLRLNFRDRLQVSSSFADWLERMLEPDVASRFSSSTKALEVLKTPPKAKFKPTLSKLDRAVIGSICLTILVLVFCMLDRYKYYWLDMAGFVSNEPFKAMSANPKTSEIQSYLDRGFNINARDGDNRNLMYFAMQNDLPEIVRMLIDRGIDLSGSDTLSELEQSKLEEIEQMKKSIETAVQIESAGYADPAYKAHLKKLKQQEIAFKERELRDNHVNAIADYAVRQNRISILEMVVNKGVNIKLNYLDKNRLSFLHLASVHQDGEIVKFLLDRGIDPNTRDSLGCTPLHTAIVRDLMPYQPKLSTYINNVNINNVSKKTINYLVSAGADLHISCNLISEIDRNYDSKRRDKIDSIAKLIRSRNGSLGGSYNYFSPVQLLSLLDININLD